jgi:large repetitive protein
MYTLSGNIASIIDPKSNDVDVDTPFTPQTFSLSWLSVPGHGTLSISGWILRYTPVMGYVGADSFMYTIQDQFGALSNTGTVNITVMPVVNIPPVGFSGSYTLLEDGSYAGTLSGSDANNDTITFSASTLPLHGSLSLDASWSFIYTPSPDYNGSDSFTFYARDAQSSSAETTIQLSITPISDTPVVQNDTVFVPRNGNATILALQNDTDADNPYQPQTLTITGYTLPANGSLSVVGTGFFYTPTMGFSGTDMFEYIIVDQDSNFSNTGTVNITVSPVNQPPVASMDVFTGAEDTIIIATLSWSDPDETPVTYILDTPPSSGIVSLSMTGLMTFTPEPNFYGSVVFLYRVSDGILSSPAVSVVLNVTSVNDLPVANNDTLTGAEDTVSLINTLLLNDTDVDSGSILSISGISTSPLHGTAVLSWSNLIEYTPTLDFCGTDMFQYVIEDEFSGSSLPATVNINVACINDAPILTGQTWTTTGNIWTNSGNILIANLVSLDPDMDVMTYSIVSGVNTGSLLLNPTGIFTYTPPLGFSGTVDFMFTASDGISTGSTVTGSIFVLPNTYNVPPVSYSVSLTGTEDMSLVGTFSWSDIENDPLSYTLVSTGAHGTVIVQSGGTFLYVPNTNYFGSDSFTYHVMDPFGSGNTSTVLINLASVNDAPVALNDSGAVLEDSVNNIVLPLGNDSDVDGDILSLTGTVTALHGTAMIVWNQIQYVPNTNYFGSDTLTYTVTDGTILVNAQVALTINNIADAPVVPNTTFHVNEDAPLLLNIYSGATDADGDTLSLSGIVSLPIHGTAMLSGGLILYSPTSEYNGTDSFTFQITDGSITTAPITASIIVHPINDAPIGTADTVTSIEDTPFVIPVLANDIDIDGDSLSISAFTQPLHGTVWLSWSGLRYTPSLNYSGADMFTYTLSDGTVSVGPVSVALTVLGVNDAPTVSDRGYTLTGNIVLSPGIVLSGWFLSGYLATQNIFSSGELSVSNTDIDWDILTFSFLAPPTSWTIALLPGRFFSYTPAPDFVGLVTIPFRATDGILTSWTGILSLCIVSPNPNIPLPSCAPGYRPPMSNIVQWPGGGWGGGSASMSSPIFGQAVSNGVASNLTSQLFLSTRVLNASGVIVPVTVQSVLTKVPKVPYTALFDTIQETITSTQGAFDLTNIQSSTIRSQAQKYARSLMTTSSLTDDQKIEQLDQSIETLDSHLEENLTDRQYGLIQYMIRLFQSKKTYLLPSMEIWKIII